jgi:hypothetical protein
MYRFVPGAVGERMGKGSSTVASSDSRVNALLTPKYNSATPPLQNINLAESSGFYRIMDLEERRAFSS